MCHKMQSFKQRFTNDFIKMSLFADDIWLLLRAGEGGEGGGQEMVGEGKGRKGEEEGEEWEGDSFGPRSPPYYFLRIYAHDVCDKMIARASMNGTTDRHGYGDVYTIAVNCLVFEKIAFFCNLVTDRQTNRQTDRRTDGQARCMKPLSLLRAAA